MRIDNYRFEHILRNAAQREVALKFALMKTAQSIEETLAGPLTLEKLACLKDLARDLRQLVEAADLLDVLPQPWTIAFGDRQES